MGYQVTLVKSAVKALASISPPFQNAVKAAIVSLANNPRPQGCKKLSGRDAYRIRVGDYRIIYEIIDSMLVVTVLDVGHRREVYRRK